MKPISILFAFLTGASLSTAVADIDAGKLPPASTKKDLTFAKDIKPLFEASCTRCHGEERPRAGLRLDNLEGVMKGTKKAPVIVKGDSAKSLLVEAISQLNPKSAMPPKRRSRPGGPTGGDTNAPVGGTQTPRPGGGPPAKPLTAEQVGLVRAWIDQGAK